MTWNRWNLLFLMLVSLGGFWGCKKQTMQAPPAFIPPDDSGTWLCTATELELASSDAKRSLAPCPREFNQDASTGQCCVVGTSYSKEQRACVGEPACPEGTTVANVSGGKFCDGEEDPLGWWMESCAQGNQVDCTHAAALLRSYNTIPQDLERAKELLERACDARVVEACAKLANLHMWNIAPARDTDLARELNQKSCELGSPNACYHFGFIHQFWDDDRESAIPFYKIACEGGHAYACGILRHITLRYSGTKQQVERAIEDTLLACESGETQQCYLLLQIFPQYGFELSREQLLRGEKMLDNICVVNSGHRPCSSYFQWHRRKYKEPARGEASAVSACEEGNFYACTTIGQVLGVRRFPEESLGEKASRRERAKPYLEKACQEGHHANACYGLAKLYESQRGKAGVKKKQLEYLALACEYHYGQACIDYSNALYDKDDPSTYKDALEYSEKACVYGVGGACNSIAVLLTKHHRHESIDLTWNQAVRRAFDSSELGCHEFKNRYACGNLGFFLTADSPNGLDRDHEKGLAYLKRACGWNVHWACRELLLRGSQDGEEIFKLLLSEKELAPKERLLFERDRPLDTIETKPRTNLTMFKNLDKSVSRCDLDARSCKKNKARFHKLILAALEDFTTKCKEQGDGESCGYVMRMVDTGLGPVIHNKEVVQKYARLGCEHDDASSCAYIAWRGHFYNWSEKFDDDAIFNAAKKALEFDPKEEWHARVLASIAFARAAPWDTIEPLYTAHCEAKNISNYACNMTLRRLLLDLAEINPDGARSFTQKQCEEDRDTRACALYARARFADSPGVATELVPQKCEVNSGSLSLCGELGWQLLQDEATVARGEEKLTAVCDEEHAEACFQLGQWLLRDTKLSSQSNGRKRLEEACELDHASACFELGVMYKAGSRYIEADEKRSKRFFKKSCEKFHRAACLAERDLL